MQRVCHSHISAVMDYGKRLSALTIEVMAVMIWLELGEGIFGNKTGAAKTEAEKRADEKRYRKAEIKIRLAGR